MLTEFGKALRKLRLDKSEILKEMAKRLEMSSAYLSAIENGKRDIPKGLIDKLSVRYSLSDAERQALKQAADKSLKDIAIDLKNSQGAMRDAALIFARSFEDMDEDTARKIVDMLNRKDTL